MHIPFQYLEKSVNAIRGSRKPSTRQISAVGMSRIVNSQPSSGVGEPVTGKLFGNIFVFPDLVRAVVNSLSQGSSYFFIFQPSDRTGRDGFGGKIFMLMKTVLYVVTNPLCASIIPPSPPTH